MKLNPPEGVEEIVSRLERAGYEAWCVGGAVRDALLGHPHLDWDFATAATPKQVMAVFKRTVPVGVEFGTVGVFDSGGTMHEVTTFRRDVNTDGRHAVVEFGASLDDDLARRDFTVNAMALRLDSGTPELVDPYNGLTDLAARVLRTPLSTEVSFGDDPLRMLRAARFAATLGFEPSDDVVRAMHDMRGRLEIVSAERIRDELSKLLLADDPGPGLWLVARTHLADEFLPELNMMELEQDPI
ncbi:MAG TPA: CCA tRNA nucleotidyltransferase, partial [Gemmatimonadaceae bacterium]|nr:CCA tRNA nucleotidyltransferase [Gemmatimonadaceae bacterium]